MALGNSNTNSTTHLDDDAAKTLAYRQKKIREQASKIQADRLRQQLLTEKSVLFQKQQELKRLGTEKMRLRRKLNMITTRHGSDETRLKADEEKLKEHQVRLAQLEGKTAKLTGVLRKQQQQEKGLVGRMKSSFVREKTDYEKASQTLKEHEEKLAELQKEFRKIQLEFSQKMQAERNAVVQSRISLSKETKEFSRAKSAYDEHLGKPEEIEGKLIENTGDIESKIRGERAIIEKIKSGTTHGHKVSTKEAEEIEQTQTHLRGIDNSINAVAVDARHIEDRVKGLESAIKKTEQVGRAI